MGGATELLGRHRTTLVLAGAVALALGSWMGASAYAKELRTQSAEEVESWTESAAYTYAVPVTRNSTHWPIGTVLPMGEPAYFRTVSDAILVNFTWAPTIPGGDLRGVAAAQMTLEVRAEGADGRPFWTIERSLDEARTDDVAAGLALSGRIDLDEVVREVDHLLLELPTGDARQNWSVRTSVVYAINGPEGFLQGRAEQVLPIGAADPRFVLPGPEELAWETPHGETRTMVSAQPAGWRGVLSSVKALAVVALGLIAVALGALAPPTGGGAAFERELRKYRDWVSVAQSVPEEAHRAAPLVDVGSLEDLVHVASDAHTRVVLDQETRVFYALLPGVTYRYARFAVP